MGRSDPTVSSFSPSGSPRVLDDDTEISSIWVLSVTYGNDSVVKFVSTAFSDDSGSVLLEGSLSLDGNSDWSVVEGSNESLRVGKKTLSDGGRLSFPSSMLNLSVVTSSVFGLIWVILLPDKLVGGKVLESINHLSSSDTSCLLYTSPSPRDKRQSRMPSSA